GRYRSAMGWTALPRISPRRRRRSWRRWSSNGQAWRMTSIRPPTWPLGTVADLFLEIVGDEAVEQAHAVAGRTLVPCRAGLRGPDHPGDVEMRPADAVIDEALEELRGGDRAALARADILHVGDRRIDQLVEGVA